MACRGEEYSSPSPLYDVLKADDDEEAGSNEALASVQPLNPENDDKHTYWEAIFVTLPMFAGYAALVILQHQLKVAYAISDTDISASKLFSFAVSFQYIGNLIFRLAHNFVFCCIRPRHRV